MNARAWVKKATLLKGNKSKQRARSLEKKGLLDVYQGDGILVGSDNHRAHIWFDSEIEAGDPGEISYPLAKVLNFNKKGRKGVELCEFSTYSLKKACTVALSLFKKRYKGDYIPQDSQFIYVHIDYYRIEIASGREEVGSMLFTLKDGDIWKLQTSTHDLFYKFRADDPDHFYINPKYLKQALEGMGKSAVLRKNEGLLHFTGENGAEALVMTLRFDDFVKLHTPRVLVPIGDPSDDR